MTPASFAVKALAALLLLGWLGLAWAAGTAAVVVSLTGTVSVQRTDGRVLALARDSVLVAGDIVLTEKGSSARLRFNDDSTVALRAASRLVIQDFSYQPARPEEDRLVLNLVKGGMRTVSGAIGKRGDPNAHQTRTAAGTIGIRGTDYGLMQCADDNDAACQDLKVPGAFLARHGGIPAGLYMSVFEGTINLTNRVASKDYAQGKSGYVRDDNSQPEAMEDDPGLPRGSLMPGLLPTLQDSVPGTDPACLVR